MAFTLLSLFAANIQLAARAAAHKADILEGLMGHATQLICKQRNTAFL